MKPNLQHLRRHRGDTKYIIPKFLNKGLLMNTSSFDIVCATDFEEFYYDDTDELVPEGEPVGVDVATRAGVELILFSNIYWNPQYEIDYED